MRGYMSVIRSKKAVSLPVNLMVVVAVALLVLMFSVFFLEDVFSSTDEGFDPCHGVQGVRRDLCNTEVSYEAALPLQDGKECCVKRKGKKEGFDAWVTETKEHTGQKGVVVGKLGKNGNYLLNPADKTGRRIYLQELRKKRTASDKLFFTIDHHTVFSCTQGKDCLLSKKKAYNVKPKVPFQFIAYNEYADGKCSLRVRQTHQKQDNFGDYVYLETESSVGANLGYKEFDCKKGNLAQFSLVLDRVYIEPKAYMITFTLHPKNKKHESISKQIALYVNDSSYEPPRRIIIDKEIVSRRGENICFLTAKTQQYLNDKKMYEGRDMPTRIGYIGIQQGDCQGITFATPGVKKIRYETLEQHPYYDISLDKKAKKHCILFGEPETAYFSSVLATQAFSEKTCTEVTFFAQREYEEVLHCDQSCEDFYYKECNDYSLREQGCRYGVDCYWDTSWFDNTFLGAGKCVGCLAIQKCSDYGTEESCVSNQCLRENCTWVKARTTWDSVWKGGRCQKALPPSASCEGTYTTRAACRRDRYNLGCFWNKEDPKKQFCDKIPANIKEERVS